MKQQKVHLKKPPKAPPQRTCMGTGTTANKASLMRFVLGPDNHVMYDRSGKAPGRGAYCTYSKKALETALKKRALTRKLGGEIPAHFIEDIEQTLRTEALKMLGLAKKSNALCVGAESILKEKHGVKGLLLAIDIGQDTAKKLNRQTAPKCQIFTNDELAMATGLPHISAIGLTNARFWPKFRQLNAFLGEQAETKIETEMDIK